MIVSWTRWRCSHGCKKDGKKTMEKILFCRIEVAINIAGTTIEVRCLEPLSRRLLASAQELNSVYQLLPSRCSCKQKVV